MPTAFRLVASIAFAVTAVIACNQNGTVCDDGRVYEGLEDGSSGGSAGAGGSGVDGGGAAGAGGVAGSGGKQTSNPCG